MKILVPIDGSSYSENSLAFVASRATLLGHNPQIELLAVLAALPNRAARLVGKDSLTRYYEDEAEKIFKPARKYLKAQNIEATEAFLIGQPAEQIAEEAKRLNADLIIMGSRGLTALKGLILGSVTEGVLARTNNPLLVIRGSEAPKKDDLKVGIAVDGSKYGAAAVKYAIRNHDLFGDGAKFYILNVASDYTGAVMPDMAGMALPALSETEVLELQKKEFSEAVDPIRPLLQKAGIPADEVCLVGNPGDEIAAYARKKHLDLIVMGSHGYGRFKSAVMGSVATRIASQGKVPLLIIRH